MHFVQSICWDKGEFREINEDSIGVQSVVTTDGPISMCIVCDGIGGLSKGEVASGMIVAHMTGWFYEKGIPMMRHQHCKSMLQRSIRREILEVHELIRRESLKQKQAMGSTMTLLLLFQKKFLIYHIGDCRCFRLKKKAGKLTKEQQTSPNVLSQAIGYHLCEEESVIFGRQRRGEAFLLCSDGFCSKISEKDLLHSFEEHSRKTIQSSPSSNELKLKEILRRVRNRGEQDNCSAIYIQRRG